MSRLVGEFKVTIEAKFTIDDALEERELLSG